MTTNTEPNQQALSEVLKEDEVGLVSYIMQQSQVDDLMSVATSLGECNIVEFQSYHALPNTNETLIDVYQGDFMTLYDSIEHDNFRTSDAYVFLTYDSGVFTRSESDYQAFLQDNQSDLIRGYLQSYVNGLPIIAIPNWFEAMNEYINERQLETTE